jgi:polysaccharide pyruvyl transferase CsaB
MNQHSQNIVVCGHYGSTNIGDEAIGLSIIQSLKKTNPDSNITFLSYNPENTKRHLGVKSEYLLPLGVRSLLKGKLFKTLKVIKNCDKFILGGGGLFTDEKLFAVFLWGIHAFWAYRYKKPVIMLGQSVGPLNTGVGKWIVKKCFNKATEIDVRDTESKQFLINLGIKKEIQVSSDLVFNLKIEERFNNEELNKKVEQLKLKGYFIVSLRNWPKNTKILYKKINRVLYEIIDKYKLLPVFIPFQHLHQNDEELMHKIIEQSLVKYPILIQKFDHNVFKVLSVIKNAEFTLGMRLHSLIFSIIQKVPVIALSYSPKINNMLNDQGLSEFIVKLDDPDKILSLVDKIMIKNKNN